MSPSRSSNRRVMLPLLGLVSAALLIIGARHPTAVASCGQQSSSPDSVTSGGDKPVAPKSPSGELCPEAAFYLMAVDERSGQPLQTSLAGALAAALAPAGQGASTTLLTTAPLLRSAALRTAFSSPAPRTGGLIWPVVGPLTQAFGVPELGVGSPHTGIDIGLDAGSPVRAAQSGRIVFSGGDPCCSLGYWLEINHGDRYASRYGHLMRPPLVLTGDFVTQGQIVGFSGNTGFSTGPHVHLEVRLDGVPIDPLRVLPGR